MEVIGVVLSYYSGVWGLVELAGTAFSLICVYLAIKHNQWTWFFGALGVLLFGVLFFEFKLYSDAALQILFFLPVQLWGFLKWREIAEQTDTNQTVLSLSQPSTLAIVFFIGMLTVINGYGMASFTDASFPYADAWTTWMSVFAQILMIKKYWQAWVLWIVMDVGAVYIYFAKGLFVVSGLYGVFLVLATMGLIKWYKDWKVQNV